MSDEPCDADPGADAERREETVVNRSGHRSTAGEQQDRGEDDAGADRADPGQFTAQVAMEQRPARRRRGARARARRRTSRSRGALRLRGGRVGAERAIS